MTELIIKLKQFGFSQNEAKSYISLLQKSPMTGYEISQRSGVPRSAIYEILKKLELRGVLSSDGDKPLNYMPVHPDELFLKLTSQFEHNLNELKSSVSEFDFRSHNEKYFNIKGYQALIDQARTMINNAKKSIYCSCWNREFEYLKPQLENVDKKGVDIVLFSFTKINTKIRNLISYNVNEDRLRNIWHRQLMVIVDKKVVLLGGAEQSHSNKSIFTDNPAILNIALNYLILDLTLISDRKKLNLDELISNMIIGNSTKLEDLL
tara:strand:- start:25 stop:816 length:792 start_codon:yes stop_codon:yes gene_type:complete